MIYNLIALLGVLSLIVLFAGVAYGMDLKLAGKGVDALVRWRSFLFLSILFLVLSLVVTWGISSFTVQSTSNLLNSISRIFSYALMLLAFGSAVSSLVAFVGLAWKWFESRV